MLCAADAFRCCCNVFWLRRKSSTKLPETCLFVVRLCVPLWVCLCIPVMHWPGHTPCTCHALPQVRCACLRQSCTVMCALCPTVLSITHCMSAQVTRLTACAATICAFHALPHMRSAHVHLSRTVAHAQRPSAPATRCPECAAPVCSCQVPHRVRRILLHLSRPALARVRCAPLHLSLCAPLHRSLCARVRCACLRQSRTAPRVLCQSAPGRHCLKCSAPLCACHVLPSAPAICRPACATLICTC